MSSTITPTVSNHSSIMPINPNMDQFNNIEKLNLNDLTEEYIDIYVPLEIIEGNSIKNINLNYDLCEPSAKDLIILNADEYIKNSNFNIKITFSDKIDPNNNDRPESEANKIHTINQNIVLTKEYLSIEKYNNIYKISISNKYFIQKGIELNKYIIQPKQNNEYDMSCYFDTSKEKVEDHEFIILAEDNRNIYEVIDNTLYISLDIELEEDIANINHKNINVAINLLNKIKKPILNYTYKYNYPFEDDIQIEIINNRLYFYISEIYIKDIFNRNLSDLLLENNLVYVLNLGSTIIYYDVKINLLKKRFEIIINNYKKLRDILLYYTGDISFEIDIYDTELYNIDITNLNYNISLNVDNANYEFNSFADNIIVRSDSYSTIIINILNTDFYNKCNANLKDTIIKNSNNKNFNYHINNQFNFNGKIEDALEIRYNDTFESLYNNANLYNTETDKIEFKDINLVVNNKYKFLSKISQQITVELCNLTEETEYNKITTSDKTYNFQYINNKKDDIEFEISDDNILLCINGETFEKAFNTKLEHFSHIIPSKKFISLSGVTNSNYYNETSTGTTSSSSTSTDTTSMLLYALRSVDFDIAYDIP